VASSERYQVEVGAFYLFQLDFYPLRVILSLPVSFIWEFFADMIPQSRENGKPWQKGKVQTKLETR
jgi:hypothetical protein